MSVTSPPVRSLSVRRIARETGRSFAADWPRLLAIAAVIELPLVVVEVTLHVVPGVRSLFEHDALVPVVLLVMVYGSLSHYFLAGVVERFVHADRAGHPAPTLGAIVRDLPWSRLIAADLLLTTCIGIGLVFFVVPGLAAATWFALTLPLVNLEGRRVLDAFRRSVELVRGHAWRVAAITVSTFLGPELVIAAVVAAGSTGHVVADALVHAVPATLLLPLAALPVVLTTFDLVDIHDGPADAVQASVTR